MRCPVACLLDSALQRLIDAVDAHSATQSTICNSVPRLRQLEAEEKRRGGTGKQRDRHRMNLPAAYTPALPPHRCVLPPHLSSCRGHAATMLPTPMLLPRLPSSNVCARVSFASRNLVRRVVWAAPVAISSPPRLAAGGVRISCQRPPGTSGEHISAEPKRGVCKSTVYNCHRCPSIVMNKFQTTVPNKKA